MPVCSYFSEPNIYSRNNINTCSTRCMMGSYDIFRVKVLISVQSNDI